jgi:hypothetical protein
MSEVMRGGVPPTESTYAHMASMCWWISRVGSCPFQPQHFVDVVVGEHAVPVGVVPYSEVEVVHSLRLPATC